MATWKKIGKVGPPQGLGGSFFLVGDRELNPSNPSIVIGEDPSCGIPAIINAKKFSQGQWVINIRGVEGRKALEGIRGQCLWSDAGDEAVDTLVGIRIVDSSGAEIGKIIEITNHGASDIVVVESAENKFVDLPLIGEFFSLPPPADGTLELIMPMSALSDLWYE